MRISHWKNTLFIGFLVLFIGCDKDSSTTLSGTVGPEGGTLTLGSIAMTVPPGAVGESIEITVEETDQAPPGHIGPAYDIGPDGTVFSSPVTITINYSPGDIPGGVQESSLALATVVDTAWALIEGSGVDTEMHSVSGAVTHLSFFGVKSRDVEVPDDADTAPDAPIDVVQDVAADSPDVPDIPVDYPTDVSIDDVAGDDIAGDDTAGDDIPLEFCTQVSGETDYETTCDYMWLCPDGRYYLISCALPRVGWECTCWIDDMPAGECAPDTFGPATCANETCCFADLDLPIPPLDG